MEINQQTLILFLRAIVNDDDTQMRKLLEEYSLMGKLELTEDELQRIYKPSEMCNHFYVCSASSSFLLVLEDTDTSRTFASQQLNLKDIEKYIFWGTNSDPVPVVTVAKVVECAISAMSNECATPDMSKITAVLKDFRANQ